MRVPNISFEFFPPKSLGASFQLWDSVNQLSPLAPRFVSVTYGAGGTTRTRTHEAVTTIQKNYGLNVAAHLTCVDATREETLSIAQKYYDAGVREIVALRGDPSQDSAGFSANPDGFSSSVELIKALRVNFDFHIRVGAYPESHPESLNVDHDVTWLKKKQDVGANSAITQFFFDADTYFRFRDKCVKNDISIPIIPGILPIENWDNVRKFASRCGANIPSTLSNMFEKAKRDGREELLSIALCSELCTRLVEGGVEDLHFYTLNKPALTKSVARALGVSSKMQFHAVA